MQKTIGELSTQEFENLIEQAIDKRFNVWLGQLLDALSGSGDEEDEEFRPEFAESLRRSLEQARSGEGIDLKAFREQIGR